MSIFDELSTDDLFYILEADNKKEIVKRFGAVTTRDFFNNNIDDLTPRKSKSKVAQSIFSAITDAPSYPLLILWSIIGLITLKVVTLSLLTGGLGALMLVTGGIFYVATYRELKNEAKKNDKFFRLMAVKNECANVLTNRLRLQLSNRLKHDQSVSISSDDVSSSSDQESSAAKSDKKMLPRIKDAVKAALMVGTTLFGTYYFGASAIIGAFGVTAVSTAMLGPIGLGIALAVTLAIGIYFGYKHYQETKLTAAIKKQQNKLSADIKEKTDKCSDLRDKLEQSHTLNAQMALLRTRKARPADKPVHRPVKKVKPRYTTQPNFLVKSHTTISGKHTMKVHHEMNDHPRKKKMH